jgi:hypothetical protein
VGLVDQWELPAPRGARGPALTFHRPLRKLLLTLALWTLLAVVTTLGRGELPKEECYPVALFERGGFRLTGEWRCLR